MRRGKLFAKSFPRTPQDALGLCPRPHQGDFREGPLGTPKAFGAGDYEAEWWRGEAPKGTFEKVPSGLPQNLWGRRLCSGMVARADRGGVRSPPRSFASGPAKTLTLRPHASDMVRVFEVSLIDAQIGVCRGVCSPRKTLSVTLRVPPPPRWEANIRGSPFGGAPAVGG